jgi:hypothetical protein
LILIALVQIGVALKHTLAAGNWFLAISRPEDHSIARTVRPTSHFCFPHLRVLTTPFTSIESASFHNKTICRNWTDMVNDEALTPMLQNTTYVAKNNVSLCNELNIFNW